MKKILRYPRIVLLVLGVAFVVLLVRVVFDATPRDLPSTQPLKTDQVPETLADDELEARIQYTCRYCHAFPRPETFPRDKWHFELAQAYSFIQESDIDRKRIPPFQQTLEYFQFRAPENFALPKPVKQPDRAERPLFRRRSYGYGNGPDYPGASHVKWVHLRSSDRYDCLVCDMLNNTVLLWRSDQPDRGFQVLANILHPGHAEVIDLDRDGNRDILVASLGSVKPTNDPVGEVIWLRYNAQQDRYQPIVLAGGLGRVADIQAADFDADGDDDLVVAVFGWLEIGRVLYLENRTSDYDRPEFHPVTIDESTGAIHVPVVDLDQDGRPDFVALLSQEHEQVVAFLNDGPGRFRKELIYDAENPGYGSSGIHLTDLDGDGDIDVLLTNGDTLDLKSYKPYHSVQWLENEGHFPFRHHHLLDFPGALSAVAADLDLDGDQDIFAVSWIPDVIDGIPESARRRFISMVWLEQMQPGVFVPRVLETGRCYHTAADVIDFDGDGDFDLVTANCIFPQSENATLTAPRGDWITIWENRSADSE